MFSWSMTTPPETAQRSVAIDVLRSQNCWHRDEIQQLIAHHCHQLTDEGRARITIGLANCHLSASGFDEVYCPLSKPIRYVG